MCQVSPVVIQQNKTNVSFREIAPLIARNSLNQYIYFYHFVDFYPNKKNRKCLFQTKTAKINAKILDKIMSAILTVQVRNMNAYI